MLVVAIIFQTISQLIWNQYLQYQTVYLTNHLYNSICSPNFHQGKLHPTSPPPHNPKKHHQQNPHQNLDPRNHHPPPHPPLTRMLARIPQTHPPQQHRTKSAPRRDQPAVPLLIDRFRPRLFICVSRELSRGARL